MGSPASVSPELGLLAAAQAAAVVAGEVERRKVPKNHPLTSLQVD